MRCFQKLAHPSQPGLTTPLVAPELLYQHPAAKTQTNENWLHLMAQGSSGKSTRSTKHFRTQLQLQSPNETVAIKVKISSRKIILARREATRRIFDRRPLAVDLVFAIGFDIGFWGYGRGYEYSSIFFNMIQKSEKTLTGTTFPVYCRKHPVTVLSSFPSGHPARKDNLEMKSTRLECMVFSRAAKSE